MAFSGLKLLTADARSEVILQLWQSQNGRCYISEKPIDLELHSSELDIDHIIPTRDNGKDDVSNWALTFQHYNRSKQASDLRVARVLARLDQLRETIDDPRGINLGHILSADGGGSSPTKFALSADKGTSTVRCSFAATGAVNVVETPLWTDALSGLRHAFLLVPIEHLFHDDRLNPRGIGTNIRGLIEEFHRKFPQLHVPLAWIDTQEEGGSRIRIFDGQHKAAAQILLGVRHLPIRIFVDPDPDLLLTANTHAGTTLRQVAFDKATQRHLGASILRERIERFRNDRSHPDDYASWTEEQLVDHFRGEQAQMRRYVIDAQRTDITYHADNRLRDFIEMGGKAADRPISYSSIEKSVFSQTIFGGLLDTPDDHKSDTGENPRDLERDQIVRLMNLIADRIYVGRYNLEIGSGKLESKVQKNLVVPDEHLRAHRLGREEILGGWIGLVLAVMQMGVVNAGKLWNKDRPFHQALPEPVWQNVDNFIVNFSRLPLWGNRALSATIFGGRQNAQFWVDAFTNGTANQIVILPGGGINLVQMISPPS